MTCRAWRKVRVGRYRASGTTRGTVEKRVGRPAHTEASRRDGEIACTLTRHPTQTRRLHANEIAQGSEMLVAQNFGIILGMNAGIAPWVAALGAAWLCVMVSALLWQSGAGRAYLSRLRWLRRAPVASRFVLAVFIAVAILRGGAKSRMQAEDGSNGNGEVRLQDSKMGMRDAEGGACDFRFTGVAVSSNEVSLSLAWTTNFSPAKAWLELYGKLHSLTNGWDPLLSAELADGETNAVFSVERTNGVSTAFYTARVDTLSVTLDGCVSFVGEDGSRLFVAENARTFGVTLRRPERPASMPAPDPVFATNPFAYSPGLFYDVAGGVLSVVSNGFYTLPDGSQLFVSDIPKVTFGSPHAYAGRTLSFSQGGVSVKSPYPLDGVALCAGWSKGASPLTGCSCVPEVDFGDGMVVRGGAGHLRSVGDSPGGFAFDYDYEPGGVWVTCLSGTNVVWRKWAPHNCDSENGGKSDSLDDDDDGIPDPEEGDCECGDDADTEGPSLGSVRFRIPLGSPSDGIISGFLYIDSPEPFIPEPASFRLLARGDASVSDTTTGGVRNVACSDFGGRTVVLFNPEWNDDVVVAEVHETATGALLHKWTIEGDSTEMTFMKTSRLDNTMASRTISHENDAWIERDNISDVEDERRVLKTIDADGFLREERVVRCGGLVAIHTITDSSLVGTGTNAVLRETARRELGADGAWKTSVATYWNDPAHPKRHGSARLVSGDDRQWVYTAFDECGRETFRLVQRDGSPPPLDSSDWSLSNLPSGVAAFAEVRSYDPVAGDSSHTNDLRKARVISKYAVSDGSATLVARTWRTYFHSETNGLPVVTVITARASSASAGMGDPGNAVTCETRYDEQSGLLPYCLRGALVSATDENGVETLCETEFVADRLRTRERKFFSGVEFPVRRISETDIRFGNLLFDASEISSDGSQFDPVERVYDEKNRLRSVSYRDGSVETNEYSCCRLLWSRDRNGALRGRYAETGKDHLYHAFVDASVSSLPKEDDFYDEPWGYGTFRNYAPVTQHRFDGLGRETNTTERTGKFENNSLSMQITHGGLSASSTTIYPQGVSDVSETTGYRGLVTHRKMLAAQDVETTIEEECEPGEMAPSIVVTNVSIRGGGSVIRRAWRDAVTLSWKWTETSRFSSYGADGCRTDYDVTESSDNGAVTNSAAEFDFLGRTLRRATPASSVVSFYDGASSRVLCTYDEVSGVVTTNLYDETGEQIGNIASGVASESRTEYVFRSNAWWKVVRTSAYSGDITNTTAATFSRLTGFPAGMRSEILLERDGALAETRTETWSQSSFTLRETVTNATSGVSWTVYRYGYPVEEGTPSRIIENKYGPTGKVYVRQRRIAGGGFVRFDVVSVDALGDEINRAVCSTGNIISAPCFEYGYDCRGNRCEVIDPLGNGTETLYDPDGNVVAEDGATYPTEVGYDTSNRRTALRTTRDGETWDETAWAYDAATGACTNKTYADGSTVAYTHTPDALPESTTFASGRWTENLYDANRRLAGVAHSDSMLDYSIARDVFGRATNVIGATGREWRYEYGLGDTVLREESGFVLDRSFDAYARPVGCSLSVGGVAKGGVGYAYDGEGNLSHVFATNAAGRVFSVAYTNLAGYSHGYAVTTQGGDELRRAVSRGQYRRELATGVSTKFNGVTLDSYSYSYDALSRPTTRNSDAFGYNERGEVISAQIGTNQFAHAYDLIGNQTNFVANAATNTYAHNALNQIETATVPSFSILNSPFSIFHDLDGNLTNDSVFAYSYDAANRLASVSSNGIVIVANEYDYRNRRIRKTTPTTETTFVYDGWNLIHETVATISGATTNTTEIQCFWGADLSGTLQGAGGVGGLLAVSLNGNFYFPAYDNNGNIMKYIDENGNVVAAYEYNAFGKTISQSGHLAGFFRHRFSTKYYDPETALYYYGYRFYSPALMRWLNRDSLEEDGGVNLYSYCVNNALSRVDTDGLASIADYVLANIGYDRSFPIFRPYGLPVPALAARLQIQIYVSGNYAECCKNGKKKKYAKGTIGAEAYLTWGVGTSRSVKGRDRNKPDPNRPGSKMKDNLTNPPDSGYRSRSWHIDGLMQNTTCPEPGLHFSGLTGVIFLRGSAGYGAGVQVNVQKEFRAGVDLTEGWSASLSGAWGVLGATIDFGGGGSGSWTYLQD